jgi:hypothetical protein
MGACCHNAKKRSAWQPLAMLRWVVPSALLAVMPKCPACVATYVALLTGVGISLPAAWYIRTGMILVCLAALVYLVVRKFRAIKISTRIWRTP